MKGSCLRKGSPRSIRYPRARRRPSRLSRSVHRPRRMGEERRRRCAAGLDRGEGGQGGFLGLLAPQLEHSVPRAAERDRARAGRVLARAPRDPGGWRARRFLRARRAFARRRSPLQQDPEEIRRGFPPLDALRSADNRAVRGDCPGRARPPRQGCRRHALAGERTAEDALVVARPHAAEGDAAAVLLRRRHGGKPRGPAPPRSPRRRRSAILRPATAGGSTESRRDSTASRISKERTNSQRSSRSSPRGRSCWGGTREEALRPSR